MLVEMLLHLGRLAYGEGKTTSPSSTLSTAQWTALRYLHKANGFSRTPSAFAKFHGTTRGTASQTIRSLVKQGFLTQSRAAGDGRGRQLDLTEKAKAMRLCDPFEAVVRAAGDLPPAARRQFGNSLTQVLNCVAREKGARPFGTCTSCAYLECGDFDPKAHKTYACRITKNLLDTEDLEQLCVNFQRAEPSAAARAATQ
ncbi:MAG: MarR family transcriptional regulator [Proteobacteria bacterium]|nr:MarR family transcriptional regulator [Pseudomonadota bacterium]